MGIETWLFWGGLSPSDYNNARMSVTDEIHVAVDATVNGDRRSFPSGTTLSAVVTALGLEPERVAIELNRHIVKRDLWLTTVIDSGAEIEIVQFVGGG